MEKAENRDTVSDSLFMETQGQLVGTKGSWNGREEVGEKVGVSLSQMSCSCFIESEKTIMWQTTHVSEIGRNKNSL